MKKIVVITMSMLTMIGMTSCVDKIPGGNGGKTVENVVDLKIPANFDWNMSSKVVCQISSANITRVFVSESRDAEPFATFFVGGDAEPMELAIPTATGKLYVQYETTTGKSAKQEVNVAGGVLAYQVPQGAAKVVAKADDDPIQKEQNGVIYIPANGWGTLMFEDQWPGYGDFDFNDIAVNYKVQLYIADKNNNINAMMIGVRVKAIGGSIPFDLFLQALGVKPGDIDDVQMAYEPMNAVATPEIVVLNPKQNIDTDNLILRFDGIRDNKNKPAGSTYLNTESGLEISA